MRHARLLAIATLSLALVAACTTASAGWTYVPAPSMTPDPEHGRPPREPSASGGGDNVVQISALGIKYEQTAVTVTAGTSFQIEFDNKDAGVPHNVDDPPGRRDRRRAVQGRRSSTGWRPAPTPSRRSMPAPTRSCAPSIRR